MSLKQKLLDALAPREEPIELLGDKLVVRELSEDADAQAFAGDVDDLYRFVVRCTFDQVSGEQVFTDEDIPMIKSRSKTRLAPLLHAVGRVNGWEGDDEVGNSVAGRSSELSSDSASAPAAAT